ncbi:MAG: hypothetical protein J5706_05570, partial [Elusimicrobiales bacterium]|nr:hypothetical protein [Elusimicrobiales bacterium]
MPSSTWVESKKKTEQVKKSKAVIDWIKENRETFWGGIGIFAAIVLFIVFFSANYSKVQKNAWQSLFMAQQNAYGGNIEQAL